MKESLINKLIFVVCMMIFFLLGFISSFFIDFRGFRIEKPSSLFSFSLDRASPSDWIKLNQIKVEKDRVIIYLKNPVIAGFAPTHSMDPTFDAQANAIQIKPNSPKEIKVGDIVVFEKGRELIVHRVVEIGKDKYGWYCITKGDNNPVSDGKIRFEQIKWVVVAVIY